jgi:hypothetical protein
MENEKFIDMELENAALITNFGDCGITLTYGLLSCFIMTSLHAIFTTVATNQDLKAMYNEGGKQDTIPNEPSAVFNDDEALTEKIKSKEDKAKKAFDRTAQLLKDSDRDDDANQEYPTKV